MRKYFKQFPYPGWIILFTVFILGTIVAYNLEKQQLNFDHLAQKVQGDFNKREATVYVDTKTGFFNLKNQDTINVENSKGYDWIILEKDQQISWNTNNIALPTFIKQNPDSFLNGKIVHLNYKTYFLKSYHLKEEAGAYALTFIPILYKFAFESKFFKSHFLADNRIPVSTQLSDTAVEDGIPIFSNSKKVAFYLQFKEDPSKTYSSGLVVWLFNLASFFCLFIFVHKFSIEISKRYKNAFGLFFLLGFILLFSFILYGFGLPRGLNNAAIFSPNLLSSDRFVISFGSLIYLALCDTWILLFVLMYIEIPKVKSLNNKNLNVFIRLILVAALVFILYFIQADRIYKLIIDSKISFEVSDFSRLNVYTFLGLFVISVITINFIFILQLIRLLLQGILSNVNIQYLYIGLLSFLCILLLYQSDLLLFYFIIFFMCIAGLVLLHKFGLPIQFFREKRKVKQPAYIYIWFIILCAWISIVVFYFNFSKEQEIRKVYAGKKEQRDDVDVRFAFDDLSQNIQGDNILKQYLINPKVLSKQEVDRQISSNYISGVFNKYQVYLYYFDKNGQALLNQDTLDAPILRKLKEEELFTENGIVYINDLDGKSLYWGMSPVFSYHETSEVQDTLGFIGFNFTINKYPISNFTPSVLQRKYNPSDQQYFDKYNYAVYKNGALWAQGGGATFPFKANYNKPNQEYTFTGGIFNSTLYYNASPSELIVVSYKRNLLINFITLFSYVLAVILFLLLLILFLRFVIFHPIKWKEWAKRKMNLSIRAKVNIAILSAVFLSLSLVGVITVSYIKNRFMSSQQETLKNFIFYFGQNMIHYIEDENIKLNANAYLKSEISSDLSYKLNALAKEQSLNINLYNKNAKLIATSQGKNVQKNFMSDHMNRSAFLNLRTGIYSNLFVSETIGDLKYESVYLPLRNSNDQIIAYMNLPYYSSQIKLKEEISNVLVDLINIYTFIFLISGISAIFISNNIVKTFSLLIQQFRKVRLKHNVLLSWPHDDELSLLVNEYNAMIVKVEDLAARLASNEREAGWRDLALQVAHEIKNPLTPMKLNIQFLQNAIKNNRADMPELAKRITKSIIEEIENLNIIASEFAYFAKMPEPQPELISIKDALASLVELFQSKDDFEIQFNPLEGDLMVFVDKSNFRRVFTNLIKNAGQAIPDERKGLIIINYKLEANNVIIQIKDNGSGISEELQDKMFTHYFTTKSSGTGIGLSMCKKMVENAHGTIWFETIIDVGTSFFVSLPYKGEKQNIEILN